MSEYFADYILTDLNTNGVEIYDDLNGNFLIGSMAMLERGGTRYQPYFQLHNLQLL